MSERLSITSVSHRRNSLLLVGLLACMVSLTEVGPALADDNAPPATQPAKSLDAQKLFAQASPAVVKIRIYSKVGRAIATGSGFLIDASGTIVTNHHVIKNAASARVYIQGRSSLSVTKIIGVDKKADLAIIKVDGKDLPFLKLKVALPKIGEKVYAIGSPRGLTNTLSDGLVSGLRQKGGVTRIQTSAPITHGSSGGPLLSSDGAVVGVTSSGLSGGGDLNFAVPSESVASLIKKPALPKQGTPGLRTPPDVKAKGTPKVYKSVTELLSAMPRNLVPTGAKPFSSLQRSLFNKWIAEKAKNIIPGTVVHFTGKLANAKAGKSNTVNVIFERSTVSIHGRKGLKEVFASFDERFIEQFLKLEPGETLAIHGKIVGLSLTAWASDCCCYLSLSLSDCAFSKPPLGQTPKPTSRLATPKPKRTDEDRARSQLSLARSYIGAGLKAKALNVLKTLIKKYPKTHAARTAAEELKKLGKQ